MPARPYSFTHIALRYIRYYFLAKNGRGHGIHSPFVYAFVRSVLMNKRPYYAYAQIEALREQLLRDDRRVTLTDFGAGTASGNREEKTIAAIARNSAKPARLGQLLFRVVNYFQPALTLELGSSLGLTAAYLAAANSRGSLVTLEGDPLIAKAAEANLRQLGLENASVVYGNFDDTLEPLLKKLPAIDLVFLDGNHRKEPVLRYFDQLLQAAHKDTVIILDDIHWSPGMEAAWEAVKAHKAVTCTIDIFFMGFVFLKPEFREPEHFVIRF